MENVSGYSQSETFKNVVPSSGTVTRTLLLNPINQTITLNLEDVDGNPFVPTVGDSTPFECSDSSGSGNYYFSAIPTFWGTEDSLTIGVVDNQTYSCTGSAVGQNQPLPVTVTVPAGQNAAVSMTVLEPTVIASFSGSSWNRVGADDC